MASSAIQQIINASGLPAGVIASLTKQYTNENSVPKLEYKDLSTTEASVVITNGNTRVLLCGLPNNVNPFYYSFLTGFTAVDGVPNHATEPTVICIPPGGDTIYFRLPASTLTIIVFQF